VAAVRILRALCSIGGVGRLCVARRRRYPSPLKNQNVWSRGVINFGDDLGPPKGTRTGADKRHLPCLDGWRTSRWHRTCQCAGILVRMRFCAVIPIENAVCGPEPDTTGRRRSACCPSEKMCVTRKKAGGSCCPAWINVLSAEGMRSAPRAFEDSSLSWPGKTATTSSPES